MADDLLGGVLGGADEQPETEAPQALAGAEAFAAAIAARASREDPGVARKTEAFLDEQTRLLETQRRHLEDEHASRLTQLRLTVAAAKRKRYADHVRNCVYTGIALIVLGVLLAAVRMTVEAMSDHSLVVEDFTVPADFAARGVTGEALAEDLESRVAAIAAAMNRVSSPVESGEVRADQGGVLKVQIPETAISIDQLERFLHRWLGHQTLVNGQLREERDGSISLELHIAGADPIVVSGSSADLSRLMQTTAEKIFAIFDPPNYILYLDITGRVAESLDAKVHWAHLAAMPNRDRAGAYALLGEGEADSRDGLSDALIATNLDPRLAVGWAVAAQASENLGHAEVAVDFYRKEIGTRRSDQPANQRGRNPKIIASGRAHLDRATGDFAALGRDIEATGVTEGGNLTPRYAVRAEVAALLHDEAGAQRDLAYELAAERTNNGPGPPGPPDITVLIARWGVSSAAGNWAQALDAAKALAARNRPNTLSSGLIGMMLDPQFRPLLAYAEAMTGDRTSATALISQTPTDCYLCVRMRGRIASVTARAAAAAGDPATAASDAATADHWFAEAVRQAPDLPMAYYEWGEALLARGDLAGAARELTLAHEKGPHFADALKAWGDVLVKEGHPAQALSKYDEALKYAPEWAALKQARADAAAKQRS